MADAGVDNAQYGPGAMSGGWLDDRSGQTRHRRNGWVPNAWRKAFGEGPPKARPAGTTDPQLWVHQGVGVFGPGVLVIGVLGLLVYSLGLKDGSAQALGVGCLLIAGAAAAGGGLGFLFGIPYSPPAREGDENGDRRYRANTSLEQISDWLTKILVGVGLVELQNLVPKLGDLTDTAAEGMGGAGARPVVAGLLSLSFVAGFLMAYLVTRTTLPRMLVDSDVKVAARQAAAQVKQEMSEEAAQGATALALVEQVLDGDDTVTAEELGQALLGAGSAARVTVFNLALRQRRAHWDDDLAKVEATVPVFAALVAADTAGRFHRNHGELGYALTALGRWGEAEQALTTAIERRPAADRRRYCMYEFHRAWCRVMLGRAEALIRDDVLAVQASPRAQDRLTKNQALSAWVSAHQDVLQVAR